MSGCRGMTAAHVAKVVRTGLGGACLSAGLWASIGSASAELTGDGEWSAVLRAHVRAVLSAPGDGLVIAVAVREGDRVVAGEALVRFDCTLPDAALARAEARLEYARLDHDSNRKLERLDSISDLEVARSAMQAVEAESDVAEARHAVDGCTVKAPFGATVLGRSVQPHENVAAGVQLLELVDDGSLVVEFLAPSHAVGELRSGRAFELAIDEGGDTRAGTVAAVIPEIDPVSRTVRVVGTLDATADDAGTTPTLVPGMSGWVSLR